MSSSCMSENVCTEQEGEEIYRWAIKALERPEDWAFSHYVATHLPTGIELWIASGIGFFSTWKPKPRIYFGRYRIGGLHSHMGYEIEPRRILFGLFTVKRKVCRAHKLWDRLHEVRHQVPSEQFKELRKAMKVSTGVVVPFKNDQAAFKMLMSPVGTWANGVSSSTPTACSQPAGLAR